MKPIRAKKKLGQHFLTDLNIARRIAYTLDFEKHQNIIEIGPGMGVLTQFLISEAQSITLVEIDSESVVYLKNTYTDKHLTLIEGDFLKLNFRKVFGEGPFAIIGNFPYNISTQIVFKTLENRAQIPFFSGMFQKEVAERICEPPGSKKYGIISVLTQLFYETELLFHVPPQVFRPPPKVDSAVIRLVRKAQFTLDCNEAFLIQVVKLSFQQRRKTLRNSLKTLNIPKMLSEDAIFDQRPEKLSGKDFVQLAKKIGHGNISN